MSAAMIDHALAAARRGLRVHPLYWVTKTAPTREQAECSCDGNAKSCGGKNAGKHPIYTIRVATTDEAQIRAWWEQHPLANVGIVPGPACLALDIDGAQGRASLAALEAEHGQLPLTYTVMSGRLDGGEHRYFSCPPERAPGDSDLAQHVNVRCRNNLVAAGSVHYTGAVYSANDLPVAAAPEWLLALLEAKRDDTGKVALDAATLARFNASYDRAWSIFAGIKHATSDPTDEQIYARAALQKEIDKLVPEGGNFKDKIGGVFGAAASAGELAEHLPLEIAIPRLKRAAIKRGFPDDAYLRRQMANGYAKGLTKPRDIKTRRERQLDRIMALIADKPKKPLPSANDAYALLRERLRTCSK